MKSIVGYIVSFPSEHFQLVWCNVCASSQKSFEFDFLDPQPLHWETIFPLSQDCHLCGCLMVKPEEPWYQDMYHNPIAPEPSSPSLEML